jgi:hypothetical protein
MKKITVELPSALKNSLAYLTGLSRKIFSLKFGALLILSLSVSWLALFLSDRLWDTPVWARIVFACSGWVAALAFGWMIHAVAFHRSGSIKWLARQVRNKFGGPGDRFLGVIELASKRDEATGQYSESLYAAALKRVEQEVSKLPLDETFDRKATKRGILAASVFVFATLACFSSFPGLSKNASLRWAVPWSDLDRETLTRFSSIPTELYTAKGEPTVLRLTLAKDTKRRPSSIHLTGPGDLSVSASRNGNFYELLIPGQQNQKDLKLSAGDFRDVIPLIPLARPTIIECITEVSYPEYLALPPFESKSMDRSVNFPKGSTLTLRGKTSRPISMMVASTESQAHEAQYAGNSFTVTMKNVQEAELAQLRFVDTYELKPKLAHTIELIAREDSPPTADFREFPPESSILLFETKNLAIQSKDDLGIEKTLLKIKAIRGNDLLIDTTLYNQVESNSSVTRSGFDFPFDPRLFTLQDGDVAEFTAFVSDRMPDREATPSRTVRFFIVGPEKHAEIIREQMEAIMARTAEIAREQENLLMETIELEDEVEASEESLDSKTERKISKLADMQRANSSNLKNNAEEGMEVLEDAIRNPLFDQEALKDFGETLEQMKSVASNQMSPASSKMQQAQASPPSEASESLEEAEELEREALSQLQEILSDSSDQLDRLEALTLAQRLRKVEKTENTLSGNLLSLLPKSIGESVEKLTPKLSLEKDRIESVQLETHYEASEVQKEISRFHERTGKPAYGEVSDLMEKEKAGDGLYQVSRKINRNVAFEALDELDSWEAKFKKWADMLEEQEEGGGQGQGQGQGEGKDITEQILALLRIRDSQKEIIAKTKVADSGNFQAQREKWTDTLADQQQELMLDLTDVQIELAEETLNPLFDDAHTAMYNSSAGLEQGKSGEQTVSAQVESKEIVTDLINVLIESTCSGQSSGQGESMSGMQLLMQQMGQQPGQGQGQAAGMTPGQGSSQGGTTDRIPADLRGQNLDLQGDGRKSNRAGGASLSPPPEFKKVMESYFRNIEE